MKTLSNNPEKQATFEKLELDISIFRGNGRIPDFIVQRGKFSLERGRIYTLEGPNQAGKSTTVGAIMGLYPTIGEVKDELALRIELTTRIDGCPTRIRSVGDALRRGLVAVFQDDEMLPTMTIREQLILRHASRGIKGLLIATRTYAIKKLGSKANHYTPFLKKDFEKIFESFVPTPPSSRSIAEVNTDAENLIKSFGVQYIEILDKKPTALSGGAKAVARLVAALLHKNISILILDEALRGVQRDVWPSIVDTLLQKSRELGFGVLAITHNQEEIVRWQPCTRYFLESRQVTSDHGSYFGIVRGLPQRNQHYKLYERGGLSGPSREAWLDKIVSPTLIIADEAIKNTKPFQEI